MEIEAILKLAPVMPVITLERIEQALPLARALLAGGVRALEVTLRTPVALRAIELLAGHDEGWVVGADTWESFHRRAESLNGLSIFETLDGHD